MKELSEGLISVVVPVYKVEPFLDKCVGSLIHQTYPDLEIILVDDGSPDQCGKFCDQWAEKDKRIKVIHKKNGGLSDARNAGMKQSHGAFLAFVDSDDWIASDLYEILVEQLKRNPTCDLAVSGYKKVFSDEKDLTQNRPYDFQQISGEAALGLLIKDQLSQVVWNKLYRRELIGNIYFDVGKYHEDEFWSYQVISRARNILLTDYPGYFYRQRPGSIMDEAYSVRRLDSIEAKCRRQIYLEANYPQFVTAGKINLLFSCLYQGQLALRSMKKEARIPVLRYLQNTTLTHPLTKEEQAKLSLIHRLWLIGARHAFILVCRIRNIAQIGL